LFYIDTFALQCFTPVNAYEEIKASALGFPRRFILQFP
jgi:hypothetical protein